MQLLAGLAGLDRDDLGEVELHGALNCVPPRHVVDRAYESLVTLARRTKEESDGGVVDGVKLRAILFRVGAASPLLLALMAPRDVWTAAARREDAIRAAHAVAQRQEELPNAGLMNRSEALRHNPDARVPVALGNMVAVHAEAVLMRIVLRVTREEVASASDLQTLDLGTVEDLTSAQLMRSLGVPGKHIENSRAVYHLHKLAFKEVEKGERALEQRLATMQ